MFSNHVSNLKSRIKCNKHIKISNPKNKQKQTAANSNSKFHTTQIKTEPQHSQERSRDVCKAQHGKSKAQCFCAACVRKNVKKVSMKNISLLNPPAHRSKKYSTHNENKFIFQNDNSKTYDVRPEHSSSPHLFRIDGKPLCRVV